MKNLFNYCLQLENSLEFELIHGYRREQWPMKLENISQKSTTITIDMNK